MKKQRRKYTRKSGKRGDIVRLLATFSQGHKETADRAALTEGGNVPPELQALFKNPFKGWNLTDSEIKIRRKIGDEKYLFLMQIYHYFEDVLSKALEPDEMMSPGMRPPIDVRRLCPSVVWQLVLQCCSSTDVTLCKNARVWVVRCHPEAVGSCAAAFVQRGGRVNEGSHQHGCVILSPLCNHFIFLVTFLFTVIARPFLPG